MSAKARCYNPKKAAHEHYGARGIEVCERWRYSFEAFLQDMGSCPDGMSLDRIDCNGNYEPGNCRWATILEQNRNKRTVRFADGLPLKPYARKMGVRYTSMLKWIARGMTPQEAVEHVRAHATKPLPEPEPDA